MSSRKNINDDKNNEPSASSTGENWDPITEAPPATEDATTGAAAAELGTTGTTAGDQGGREEEEALGTTTRPESTKETQQPSPQRTVSFQEPHGVAVEVEAGFEAGDAGGLIVLTDAITSSAHQLQVEQEQQQQDYDDSDDDYEHGNTTTPIVAGFKDHFSLPVPTSRIRYRRRDTDDRGGTERNAAARIIQVDDAQIVLEETPTEISIRKIHDTSEGVRALRILYTIVVAFWTGFLLVVCLQILLYLVFDVAVQVGATSKQTAQWGVALGVIFAIIPFVYGLASALVIAGAFILDTWQGHLLIRNFALRRIKLVTVEWVFFLFFLGLPLLLMGITLLIRYEEWWVLTGLFWIASIGVFYLIFMFNVGYYEVQACWEVCRNQYRDIDRTTNVWQVVSKCILLRQRSSYSGIKTLSYLSYGSIAESEETDKNDDVNVLEQTRREYASLRSKLTSWLATTQRRGLKGLWYDKLEEPGERIYSIDDARDNRPYVTSHSWSLEKTFCRPRHSRYVAIVDGPGALTRAQIKSSVACSFIGSFLIFWLVLGGLVYLQLGPMFVGFIIAVGIIIALPNFYSTYQLYKAGKDFIFVWNRRRKNKNNKKGDGDDDDEKNVANIVSFRSESTFYNQPSEAFVNTESNAVYLVSKSFRVTRATDKLCWTMFVIEIAFLFLWPLISLFAIGNWQLGLIFLFVASITACRYYINAAVVLEEAGHMDLCDGETERDKWKNQSRLNEIIGNITRGRSRGAWMAVLGVVGFCFLALGAGAIGTSEAARQGSDDRQFIYLNDFEYTQLDSLRYPSCQVTSDLGESPITTMADFTYLAALAYREVNITQSQLDDWFGTGVALDQDVLVQQFKNLTNSQVSFKMIMFPGSGGNFSIVSIRGTTNAWDALTDAQLWSAAALMQVLRFVLPIGDIWTPLMDRLIQAISSLDSKAIEQVAFYKDTTAFVNAIKADPDRFRGVAVTGHSLGGGLSLITGAQTGVPAVALSGPNSMLSRKSFQPQLKEEALNSKTFNIIPNRDVVPMIDDRAQNFQEIRCTTATPDIIGCHSAIRSLCEIIYTCGTGNRPAICACVTEFGYPEPQPINGTTRTFAEACGL